MPIRDRSPGSAIPCLRILAVLTLGGASVAASAQSSSVIGRPYLRNFSASEYDAHIWNSSAVQDDRGVLYVGNNDGLLEYDGVTWNLIVVPGRSHVASLGLAEDGRIWIGATGSAGYLAPDSVGRARFVQVLDRVPGTSVGFASVRATIPTPDGIWFDCGRWIIRYRPGPAGPDSGRVDAQMEVGEEAVLLGTDGEAFLWIPGDGLNRLVDDRLEPVPFGSEFARRTVRFVEPAGDGRLLVGTATDGLYLVAPDGLTSFAVEETPLLSRLGVTAAASLDGNRFAVGTRSGGVVILDGDGRVVHWIDTATGLQNNAVQHLLTDREGNLWAMLEKGVSRIDTGSPMTLLDGTAGLDEVALRVRRHAGRLYAGTVRGLSVLDPSSGRFRRVPGVDGRVEGLLPVGDRLLVAAASGLHEMDGSGRVIGRLPLDGARGASTLVGSVVDSGLVFVGIQRGVAVLADRDGAWSFLGLLPLIERPVKTGTSLPDGTVWVVDEPGRAFRIRPTTLPVERVTDLSVESFGPEEGLPELGSSVYAVGGKAYFTSFGGLVFGLDGSGRRMERVRIFDDLRTGYPLDWFGFHEDDDGQVWVPLGNRGMTRGVRAPDGRYRSEPGPLRRLGSLLVIEAWPDSDGVIWMAGSEGIVRFDARRPLAVSSERQVLIRRVVGRDDSLLYAGLGPPSRIEVAHARNRIRLGYALASLKGDSEYRTMLEGFDDEWSPWTVEASRTYTNLPDGDYVFRVQGRDVDGLHAEEARLDITVLPPWYRTIWAYLLFAATAVGVLGLLRAYEMGRLRLKHRLDLQHLEAERLRDLDRVRTDFFANISHEFRTPLTLILGPVTDALDSGRELAREQLLAVQRNGRRLLRLINQILDLVKLEGGGMTLRASREDIVPFLRGLFYSFESLAERRGIGLTFSSSARRLPVLFERDRMEQVFLNVFSNAIKFTPDGGSISVACRRAEGAFVEISVTDTGCGIPADRLPHIFDRYFQSGVAPVREREGTGIGLALTRALVELHGGSIGVESELGRGTTFRVLLPCGEGTVGDGAGVPPGPASDVYPELALDPAPIEQRSGGGGDLPTVLVVEDHPDVRSYIRDCLAGTYRVLEASNGEEGLEQARSLMPDLIVADVTMPGLDGYGLTHALREDRRTSHIPIIMLTARASESDRLAGLESGVDDYQLKPFNPQEIRLRIRNLIAQREAARRRFSTATVIRVSEIEATSVDRAFLESVVASIERGLSDEDFSVEHIADEAAMSVSQLNRKLNALIDQPAGALLRSTRLQRAADLLERRAGTVGEIAYLVGYSSPSHFSTAFKKQFGVAPSAFRGDGAELA